MAISDLEVLIKILTAFDKGGMEEAKKAAKEVADSCGQASEQAKTASGALSALSKNGAQGAAALRNLVNAAKGGPGALNALGRGVSQVAGMLGAGGPWLIAIQAAVSGVQMFIDWTKKSEEEAKKAAEEAEKAAEAEARAAEKVKEIADTSFKERIDEFKELGKAADEASKQADKVAEAMLELENAKIDEQISILEGKKVGATDSQKEQIDAEIAGLKGQKEVNKAQSRMNAVTRHQKELDDQALSADKAVEEAEANLVNGQTSMSIANQAEALANSSDFAPEVKDFYKRFEMAKAQLLAPLEAAVAAAKQNSDASHSKADSNRQIGDIQFQTYAQQAVTATNNANNAAAGHTSAAATYKDKENLHAWIGRGDHLQAAQGLVRNAADAGLGNGQIVLGGAAGEDAQAKGRAAIAEAGKRIQAGENDQQVIDELCATLDKLGSVVANMGALKAHLDALDGKLDVVQRQTKNSRS